MSERRRVVVVGAGITGLTAAFTLATQRPDLDIVVLEAGERVGGKILTTTSPVVPSIAALTRSSHESPKQLISVANLDLKRS